MDRDLSVSRIFLSIVIPHQNRPDMLLELLSTVPERDDIEVIVVDDHSVQQMPHIEDERVRILHLSDGERYAGTARNIGMASSQSTWICFADSDDLFEPGAFEKIIEHAEQSSADIIYGKANSFLENGARGTRHKRTNDLVRRAQIGDKSALVKFYPPWGKLFRRPRLIERQIWFETQRVSNDVLFSARAYFAAREVEVFDEVIYRVRQGNLSLTNNQTPMDIAERLTVLRRFNTLLREHGLERHIVPAVGQLKNITLRHPIAACKMSLQTRCHGDPVIFTEGRFKEILRKFFRDSSSKWKN